MALNRANSMSSYFRGLEQSQQRQAAAETSPPKPGKGHSQSGQGRSESGDSQQFTGNTDGSQTSQSKFEALLNINRCVEIKATVDTLRKRVEEISLRQEERLDQIESKVDTAVSEIRALDKYLKKYFSDIRTAEVETEELPTFSQEEGDREQSLCEEGDLLNVEDYLHHKRMRRE